jgi:hypothetical protein
MHVLSSEAEQSVFPSGENEKFEMECSCPSKTAFKFPPRSEILSLESFEAEQI